MNPIAGSGPRSPRLLIAAGLAVVLAAVGGTLAYAARHVSEAGPPSEAPSEAGPPSEAPALSPAVTVASEPIDVATKEPTQVEIDEADPPTSTTPAVDDAPTPEPPAPAKTKKARPRSEAKPSPAPESIPNQLSSNDMRKALAAAEKLARACGAEHPGSLMSSVKVKFTIAPDGAVTSANALAPMKGTPLGTCVAAAVSEQRFPASKLGGTSTTSLSIVRP